MQGVFLSTSDNLCVIDSPDDDDNHITHVYVFHVLWISTANPVNQLVMARSIFEANRIRI